MKIISGINAGYVTVYFLLLVVLLVFIIKRKPQYLNFIKKNEKSEKLDSDHILFKKQKLELLKQEMNIELKNKRKISGEFDKMAIKINKNNQLSNQEGNKSKICGLNTNRSTVANAFISRPTYCQS